MQKLKQQLMEDLKQAGCRQDIEALRVRYIGKNGVITTLNKTTDMFSMSVEERKAWGINFNTLKKWAEEEFAEAKERLAAPAAVHLVDLTLPGAGRTMGALHPISLVQIELEQIFQGMGFILGGGRHVESEYYNFDALNIPHDHPARDMQDTFWLDNGLLLRTHTSANQVRMLQKHGAPMQAVFPGRCFRYEAVDASHENTFYQLEGLMVGKNITIANLIGIMRSLLSQVFHQEVTVRLRPGYFPFVEPGFELDCQCLLCQGQGCKTCKQTGWIELLPCGMVHPGVLKAGNVDPDEFTGFAFGLGLTRLAMMKYNIPEIRLFNSGQVSFLEQFPAVIG